MNRNIFHAPDFIPRVVSPIIVKGPQISFGTNPPPCPCSAVRRVLAYRSRSLASGMVRIAEVTEVVANERCQH